MNIRELAAYYLEFFTPLERNSGVNTYVWKQEADVPPGLKSLAYETHQDILPDDYKYNYIVDALELIADSSSDDENDLQELDSEIESDIYNWDLLKWLSSNLNRSGYVDEYVQELMGNIEAKDFDLMKLIGCGQWMEKREVFSIVLQKLREAVAEMEDKDSEDLEDEE